MSYINVTQIKKSINKNVIHCVTQCHTLSNINLLKCMTFNVIHHNFQEHTQQTCLLKSAYQYYTSETFQT